MSFLVPLGLQSWTCVQVTIRFEWGKRMYLKQLSGLIKAITSFWLCPLASLTPRPLFKAWWIISFSLSWGTSFLCFSTIFLFTLIVGSFIYSTLNKYLTCCYNIIVITVSRHDLDDHKNKWSRHQSFLYGCDRSLGVHVFKLEIEIPNLKQHNWFTKLIWKF